MTHRHSKMDIFERRCISLNRTLPFLAQPLEDLDETLVGILVNLLITLTAKPMTFQTDCFNRV